MLNKPGKTRVVFDCAAKYGGTSLNAQLPTGPDLTNSIVGVLMRFPEKRVALLAGIECMFHQVRVPPDYQVAFRFLWWLDGDLNQQPVDQYGSSFVWRNVVTELLQLRVEKDSRRQQRRIPGRSGQGSQKELLRR